MSYPTEEQMINKLAEYAATIDGINNAYGYSQNPDLLTNAQLPAIMFYPMQGDYEEAAHFNMWKNLQRIRGSLFVVPRMAMGGKLRYIENEVIPFVSRFRQKFQEATVYEGLLSIGVQRARLRQSQYGSGGLYLTHSGNEYVGCIFDWEFVWTQAGGA